MNIKLAQLEEWKSERNNEWEKDEVERLRLNKLDNNVRARWYKNTTGYVPDIIWE